MDKERIFGGNPLSVVIRLVVLSVVVGIVLSALNIRPENLFYYVRLLVQRIYDLGFGAIEGIFGYFLLGAFQTESPIKTLAGIPYIAVFLPWRLGIEILGMLGFGRKGWGRTFRDSASRRS